MNSGARAQRLLLVVGSLLMVVFAAGYVYKAVMSRAALRRFQDFRAEGLVRQNESSLDASGPKVDFSLWSEKRVAAYERSLAQYIDPPLAVLRIPKMHLEVPVLEGTDDLVLDRGVGHIAGTDRPGEDGNVGIAGHRDGFFRVLKDVGPEDTIELVTPRRSDIFTIDQITLVRPDDVSVLKRRGTRTLTLVTCYPFYFIGSAPQRYIVQASIRGSDNTKTEGAKQANLQITKN
jgi:sortase A